MSQTSASTSMHFYVAPDGDDGGPGDRDRPFATLERAQRAVRAATPGMTGDVVVNLRAGTHVLADPLELSGEAGDSGQGPNRVIYQAYGYGTPEQETAVVSGGRSIVGWTREGSLWRAEVGDLDTRQLYVDGRRARRAALDGGLPEFTLTDDGYTTESTAPLSWPDPVGIEFVYTGAVPWSEPRCGVAFIEATPQGTRIVMDQPCFSRIVALFGGDLFKGLGTGIVPTSIEGSRSFLTEPGMFHLDRTETGRHVLYYLPRPDEDMDTSSVVAPVLETLVAGTGTEDDPLHDVTFRGLTFSHATWLRPGTADGFVHYIGGLHENGDGAAIAVTLSEHAESMPGNVAFRYADRIVLERNRFIHLGAQALEIVGSENVVRGNVITDVSGGGILVGDDRRETAGAVSRGNVVTNNWIHGIGAEYRGGTGVYATRTADLTVSHNQINNVPYSGIFVGQGHEQLVRADGPQDPEAPRNTGAQIIGNHVFDYMRELQDGGGIYTTFGQGTPDNVSRIHGNHVHNENKVNFGIYSDWGSTWQIVEDNVIYGTIDNSTGGCSAVDFGRQTVGIRFIGNFWIGEPVWYMGPVVDVTLSGNTLLPRETAEEVCRADPRAAAIMDGAGLQPEYRDLLDAVEP
ncbi:right-handed parallel beta-helix repeat-containing protein [Rhizohabitans arisaemae]|uniref:right-handed parallel beta-helix repeat-containing protein n=1 Tax=Rhizohabitans arisaemae TaxID=2720610 RepID=UPI0024B0C612|nr:right-handed parallel beta-helix repeat-containing protein [Rhizohabitans arisaemae]